MQPILDDLAAHKYTAALLSLLIAVASLCASGRIDPFLAKYGQWPKTAALASAAAVGIGAQVELTGLGWNVALGRALPPLALLILVHYVGTSAAPAAVAQKAADVAAVKAIEEVTADRVKAQANAPKVPPLPLLCLALVFVLACGATPAQVKTAQELAADACVGILDLTGNSAQDHFCATAEEWEAAIQALFAQGSSTQVKTGAPLGPTIAEIEARVLEMRAAKANK